MDGIKLKSLEIANECGAKLNQKIISVDFVFENNVWILRVIADCEGGLTIDKATELNNCISEALDLEDFIDREYFLEVSSEGLEKELKTNDDIKSALGQYIYIKTYEKIDKQKEFYGDLRDFNDNVVTLNHHIKGQTKKIKIEKEKISKIRLAVKF